jgi:hypothetical protein
LVVSTVQSSCNLLSADNSCRRRFLLCKTRVTEPASVDPWYSYTLTLWSHTLGVRLLGRPETPVTTATGEYQSENILCRICDPLEQNHIFSTNIYMHVPRDACNVARQRLDKCGGCLHASDSLFSNPGLATDVCAVELTSYTSSRSSELC